ncbi:hypothetical protein THIOSC13_1350052 [uncultured Thiomicrorhabdus sp.]
MGNLCVVGFFSQRGIGLQNFKKTKFDLNRNENSTRTISHY